MYEYSGRKPTARIWKLPLINHIGGYMKQLLVLFLLFGATVTVNADEYSAVCNCYTWENTLGFLHLAKGEPTGGSATTVGDAIQAVNRKCQFGIYPATCRVFLRERMVYSEEKTN